MLHPSERSRLALALTALGLFLLLVLAIVVAAGAAGALIQLLLVVGLIAGAIWVTIQIARARQLGGSLRVSRETLPELQAIVDEIRAGLAYDRPVEVYVGARPGAPVTTVNYLGTRILLIDGDLVGGLLADGEERQLAFLVGRELGALKARLTRLDVAVLLLNAVNALRIVSPFLLPYYRATTYSGDQIGMVCAGDLASALRATRRLLVGEKLADTVAASVVAPQALVVRRDALPRFAQMFSAEPHITNRYANLLCFARYYDPALWERTLGTVTEDEASALEALWRHSPYSRIAPLTSAALRLESQAGHTAERTAYGAPVVERPPPTLRPEPRLESARVRSHAGETAPPPVALDRLAPPVALEGLPPPRPAPSEPPPVVLDELPPPQAPTPVEGGRS